MSCESSANCSSNGSCMLSECICDFGFMGISCSQNIMWQTTNDYPIIQTINLIYGILFICLALRQLRDLYNYICTQYRLENVKISNNYALVVTLLLTLKGTVYILLFMIGIMRGLWLLVDPYRQKDISSRFMDRLMDESCYFMEMSLMFIILVMFVNIYYQVRENQQVQKAQHERKTVIGDKEEKQDTCNSIVDNSENKEVEMVISYRKYRKFRILAIMIRFVILTVIFLFYLIGKSFRFSYISQDEMAGIQVIYFLLSMSAMIEVTILLKLIFRQFNDMIIINHNFIQKFQENCQSRKKDGSEEEEKVQDVQMVTQQQQMNSIVDRLDTNIMKTNGDQKIYHSHMEVKTPQNLRGNLSFTIENTRNLNNQALFGKKSLQSEYCELNLKERIDKEDSGVIELNKDLDDYYELDLRQNGQKEIFIDEDDFQWGFEASHHQLFTQELKQNVRNIIQENKGNLSRQDKQITRDKNENLIYYLTKHQSEQNNQSQQINETQSQSFRNKINQNKQIAQDKSDLKKITRYSICCIIVVFITLCYSYGFYIMNNFKLDNQIEENKKKEIKYYIFLSFVFRINEFLFLIYYNRLVGDFEQTELKNLNWIRSLGIHNTSSTQFIFQMPEYMIISDKKKLNFQMRINQDSIQKLEQNKKKEKKKEDNKLFLSSQL